ncbi:MAG: LuxR C-terminal-related transcriptional regulator [Lachnospiraceae bacterium]|nr:LuxR C-terminal-related transcriptional regulator [Lachnospiraceae bacterium]
MEGDILGRLQNACDLFRNSKIEGCQDALRERLSARELEIAQMLTESGDAEIAAALHITEQSVRDSVEAIYRKLEVRERCQSASGIRVADIIEYENTDNAAGGRPLWAQEAVISGGQTALLGT